MLPFLLVSCRGDNGWLSILPGHPERGVPSGDSQDLPLRVTSEDLDVSVSCHQAYQQGAPAKHVGFFSFTHVIYFEHPLSSAFKKYKGTQSRKSHTQLPPRSSL